MQSPFAKTDNVLALAGVALADLAVLLSAQQYVPTLHLAKTSFWNGTRINQIRFGSYPNNGLIEFARTEAVARAKTWDAWAFACIAVHPTDQQKPALLVDAGDAPLANTVRIIQEVRPPKEGFCLIGSPRFSLDVQGKVLPLHEAEVSGWQNMLRKGIDKLKTARENWERWSAPSPDETPTAPL